MTVSVSSQFRGLASCALLQWALYLLQWALYLLQWALYLLQWALYLLAVLYWDNLCSSDTS